MRASSALPAPRNAESGQPDREQRQRRGGGHLFLRAGPPRIVVAVRRYDVVGLDKDRLLGGRAGEGVEGQRLVVKILPAAIGAHAELEENVKTIGKGEPRGWHRELVRELVVVQKELAGLDDGVINY